MKIDIVKEAPPILNLSFKGCGVKIALYNGALKALYERGYLDKVVRVAGSSGGSIIALLYALGYKPNQIEELLLTIDYQTLYDDEVVPGNYFWQRWYSYIKRLWLVVYTEPHGTIKGDAILNFLRNIIRDKLGSEVATFADLHERAQSDPNFKDLYVVLTNLSQITHDIASFENKPNARIAETILAAIAYPFAFKSVRLTRETHERIPHGEPIPEDVVVDTYVDGGFGHNEPRAVFEHARYKPDGFKHTDHNPSTLTLRQDPESRFNSLFWNIPSKVKPAENLKSWFDFSNVGRLFDVYTNVVTSSVQLSRDHALTTIQLPDCGIDVLDFDMTPEKVRLMQDSSYDVAKNWYQQYVAQQGEGSCERAIFSTKHYSSIQKLLETHRLSQKEKISVVRQIQSSGYDLRQDREYSIFNKYALFAESMASVETTLQARVVGVSRVI